MENSDIIDWVFLVLALGVYFDATHHKIGKTREVRGFPNMTAGGWAAWASISYLGLVAVALYVIHRGNLIRKAELHPVETGIPHRVLVAGLLFILPMFLSYLF